MAGYLFSLEFCLVQVLLLNIRVSDARDTNEFCVGERFQPKCQSGEIIVMKSAKYGRMKLNRCIPTDLGYLGCNVDVLTHIDEQCTGKQTCELFVAEIEAGGGCIKGLERYLEASYLCKGEIKLSSHCSSHGPAVIDVNVPHGYMSSEELTTCIQQHGTMKLRVNDGQVFNISLVNLQNSVSSNAVFGYLKDGSSSKRVVFGSGPRYQHLMVSTSNVVEVATQSNEREQPRFLLQVTVNGCSNLAPPNGAWMTRQGDVMEVGCHSGAKSWTLKCENNQWTGAVGQCGKSASKTIGERDPLSQEGTTGISINVMLFGICSLIILLSAIIFLTGVCILKRKATHVYQPPTAQMGIDTATMARMGPYNSEGLMTTQYLDTAPEYKSLGMPLRYPDQNEHPVLLAS